MKRLSVLAIALSVIATACSGSSSSPTPTTPTKPQFTADLKPANEVPAITGAEATGSGTASVTWDLTRDGNNNVTAAAVTFIVNLSGFPANTPINIAHIHEAPAGVVGSVRVATTLTAGQVVLNAAGAGSFSQTVPGVTPELAQSIINNPAGFYFNVHSTLNPGGVARGQLVRVQ
jgi:hypothetical protein